MNKSIEKLFRLQREQFFELVSSEIKKDPGGLSIPSAPHALAFAEKIILCPSLEAVQKCVRKDLEGARSFGMATDRVSALSETGPGPLEEQLRNKTPLYLLAYVVLADLERSKITNPELWKA